jgi:hypothetical protein
LLCALSLAHSPVNASVSRRMCSISIRTGEQHQAAALQVLT